MFNVLISHKDEEYNLERFWNLESIGINSKELDEDDDAYIKAYQDRSIEFRENKDYAMLPGKQDVDDLSTNLTRKRHYKTRSNSRYVEGRHYTRTERTGIQKEGD